MGAMQKRWSGAVPDELSVAEAMLATGRLKWASIIQRLRP